MGLFSDLFQQVKSVDFLFECVVEGTGEFMKIFVFQIVMLRAEAIVKLKDFGEVGIASHEVEDFFGNVEELMLAVLQDDTKKFASSYYVFSIGILQFLLLIFVKAFICYLYKFIIKQIFYILPLLKIEL